jgi:hypothetical protein
LAAALLALMSLLKGPVVPSGACSKCGRPVCRRCDSEVVGPGLCGQCVTVFAHRGAIDPPQRAAKEMSIRRWLRRRTWTIRLSGIALGGAGQVLWGQAPRGLAILFPVALGAFLLAFPEGLLPAPWGASPVGLRVVPAVLLILVPWVLGVRRAFRQTAALNLIKIGVQAPPAEEPAASKPEPGPQQA